MVAYNGSPEAQSALAYGFEKAYKVNGELIVFDILRRTYPLDIDDRVPLMMEDAFRGKLSIKKDALIHRSGHKVPMTLVFAYVDRPEDILRFADEEQADLIVVPEEFEELVEKACCLVDVA